MDTLAPLELRSQVEDSKTSDQDNLRTTTLVVMPNLTDPQPLLLIHQLLKLAMNILFPKTHLSCLPDLLEESLFQILENMALFLQMNPHPDQSLPTLLPILHQLMLLLHQPISHLILPQPPDPNILPLQPDLLTLRPQLDPNILQQQPDPNIPQQLLGLPIHQLPVDLTPQLLPDLLTPPQPADPTLRPLPDQLILQPLADLTPQLLPDRLILQPLPDLCIKNKLMILKEDIAILFPKTHWYCPKEDRHTILLPDLLTPQLPEDQSISQLLLLNPPTHQPPDDPNTHPPPEDPNIPQLPLDLHILPQPEDPNTHLLPEDLNIPQPLPDPLILQPPEDLILPPPQDLLILQQPADPNILPLPEDLLILLALQLLTKKLATAIQFQPIHWYCLRENQRADLALTTNLTRANLMPLK